MSQTKNKQGIFSKIKSGINALIADFFGYGRLISYNLGEEEKVFAFNFQNWRARLAGHPMEDAYNFFKGVDAKGEYVCLADADGVSRDFIDGEVASQDMKGLAKFLGGYYPKPSPARKQATSFVHRVPAIFADKQQLSPKILYESIEEWNSERRKSLEDKCFKCDYLGNDYPGCTASLAVVAKEGDKRTLYHSFIADARVAVLRKNGRLEITSDEGPNTKGSIDKDIQKKYHTSFDKPEGRRIIRSKYRNNLDEPLSYGALTGEEKAMRFVRVGEVNVSAGDYVMVCSDGAAEIMLSEENSLNKKVERLLRKGRMQRLMKYLQHRVRSEGSLVVYKVE
jgi:hypothetical protein